MADTIPLFKPSPLAREALTSVTPDLADHIATASGDMPRAASTDMDTCSPTMGQSYLMAAYEHSDSASAPHLDADTEAARQHHLLRHSLPTEQRGSGVLAHFGVDSVSEAAKIIKKMSQRDLQAKFKCVYGARTFSNNNNWLRRKLFEAIGLDPSKGAAKKPGPGTQRRRRAPKAAPKPALPRLHRRSRAEAEADNHSVAEALLALGELANLASSGLESDMEGEDDLDGSDGCVPTASDDGSHGRQSWSQDGAHALAASRGVPSTPSKRTPTQGPSGERKPRSATRPAPPSEPSELPATVNVSAMFEWAARMHAAAAAGHHPMMAAVMAHAPAQGAPPAAYPQGMVASLPMPSLPMGFMQAMTAGAPMPAETYHRAMSEAAGAGAHPGLLALMRNMAPAAGPPAGHAPMPLAPPLFSGAH